MIAARVAAELRKIPGTDVAVVPGGFGELRVEVDGRDVYESNRFWYPRAGKVAGIVRGQLSTAV